MLNLFKKTPARNEYGLPVVLRLAESTETRTFDSDVVNSLRHMATELACNGGLPARIAFSSALRGEGVTYTALAFGATLAADLAAQICVVDLNWWSQGIMAELNAGDGPRQSGHRVEKQTTLADSERPGIAQVLAGEAALDAALVRTAMPNLDLLPAGTLPIGRRPSIARSNELHELLAQLSTRYEHLIFDVPAILTTSDAIALSALSDAFVLVVRQGVTPTGHVKRALDDVRNQRVLGVILNQVQIKTPSWIRSLIPQE